MKTQSTVIYVLVVLLTAPLAMADPRQEPPEVWQAYAQKLEAGAFVQVHLKDGKKVKGSFIPGFPRHISAAAEDADRCTDSRFPVRRHCIDRTQEGRLLESWNESADGRSHRYWRGGNNDSGHLRGGRLADEMQYGPAISRRSYASACVEKTAGMPGQRRLQEPHQNEESQERPGEGKRPTLRRTGEEVERAG